MVVQPDERNVVDQRGIEYALWRDHNVPLVRLSLEQIARHATLATDGSDGSPRLLVGSGAFGAGVAREASVVYFRAGYTPDDYPTDACWEARTLVERSLAVKCPSISLHLAGTKKVQQALAAPGELERFAPAADARQLRACFAGLYSLDDSGEAVERVVRDAIAAPDAFVLKPQREGGGNNLYGSNLRDALSTMSAAERASYILMERIRPPSEPMALMRQGMLDGGQCTCELGVFGAILSDGTTPVSAGQPHHLINQGAGHLLRVKLESVDEGGVCAGFAVLSSPALH
jgi:glutathione synthetase